MKAFIIGAGPSLKSNLKEIPMDGFIIATDKALVPTLKAGKLPTHAVTLENEDRIARFFEDEIIKKSDVVGIHSHKTPQPVINAMKNVMRTAEINSLQFNDPVNVGLFAWQIATHVFGCNEIRMIGMDYAYSDLDDYGQNERLTSEFNPHLNKDVKMNQIHRNWKGQFLQHIKLYPNVKTINMTGDGALFGEGITWI